VGAWVFPDAAQLLHDWWLQDARCIVGATVACYYMIGGYRMQSALWVRKGGAFRAATRVSVAGNVADRFYSVTGPDLSHDKYYT
jgi:hypothetical protein